MRQGRGLWRVLNGIAGELGTLERRVSGPARSVVALARSIVEDAASKALDGLLSVKDVERLDSIATLLRLYGVPTVHVRRARELVSKAVSYTREPPSSQVWEEHLIIV